MKYKPETTLGRLRLLEGCPIIVKAPPAHFLPATMSAVKPGDHVQFTTLNVEAWGIVLDVDRGAVYPIRIEYATKSGDKRIVSFSPDEFITFKLKGYQP